jgi:hypothetical protein
VPGQMTGGCSGRMQGDEVDKVLFLSGTTRGGTLEGIGRAFAPVLKQMDLELVEISLLKPDPLLPLLQSPDSLKIRFVLSCAGMGIDLSVQQNGQNINIWQETGIPFVTLLGDSPSYFFDRHTVASNHFISLYSFAEHCELRRRLPGRKGPIGILPPILLDQIAPENLDLQAKREGTLLFLKNGKDPAEIRKMWVAGTAQQVRRALFELADELERCLDCASGNRIDDMVTQYFIERDFDIERLVNLRLFFIAQLDDYIRAVKATRMVEWLMDFPVQIRGNNWGHIDFSGKKATYIDDCNYVDSIQLIRNSLGTIDVSANTASMPHDRVLRAYGSCTLCLTNGGQTFTAELPYEDELTFSFNKESLQSKVAGLLADKSSAVDKGIAVAEAFKKLHPPERAFERMLGYAAFARLDQAKTYLSGFQDFFVWPPKKIA